VQYGVIIFHEQLLYVIDKKKQNKEAKRKENKLKMKLNHRICRFVFVQSAKGEMVECLCINITKRSYRFPAQWPMKFKQAASLNKLFSTLIKMHCTYEKNYGNI
jgi:hypothetical protein